MTQPQTPSNRSQGRRFEVTNKPSARGQKVVLYGTGGIGKTTLASLAPGATFVDAEDRTQHVAQEREIRVVDGIGVGEDGRFSPVLGYNDLLSAIRPTNEHIWRSGATCIIDSLTRVEDWVAEAVVAKRPTTTVNRQQIQVTNIEDYGWGKGYAFLYQMMVDLLAELDALARKGINIIVICHEAVSMMADPMARGDYQRFEPRLYRARNGNNDVRSRVKEWCDHVLLYHYDITIDGNKLASGGKTRTLYLHERPECLAKSWLPEASLMVQAADDDTIWNKIFGG